MNSNVSVPLPQPVVAVRVIDEGCDPERKLIKFESLPWVTATIANKNMGRVYKSRRGSFSLYVSNLYSYDAVLKWLREVEMTTALEEAV